MILKSVKEQKGMEGEQLGNKLDILCIGEQYVA